jgi:hypothetical protein
MGSHQAPGLYHTTGKKHFVTVTCLFLTIALMRQPESRMPLGVQQNHANATSSIKA